MTKPTTCMLKVVIKCDSQLTMQVCEKKQIRPTLLLGTDNIFAQRIKKNHKVDN